MRLVGANCYSTDGQRLFADTESECGPFGTRDVRSLFIHAREVFTNGAFWRKADVRLYA
jgi:hypothetical protein